MLNSSILPSPDMADHWSVTSRRFTTKNIEELCIRISENLKTGFWTPAYSDSHRQFSSSILKLSPIAGSFFHSQNDESILHAAFDSHPAPSLICIISTLFLWFTLFVDAWPGVNIHGKSLKPNIGPCPSLKEKSCKFSGSRGGLGN